MSFQVCPETLMNGKPRHLDREPKPKPTPLWRGHLALIESGKKKPGMLVTESVFDSNTHRRIGICVWVGCQSFDSLL